MNKSFIKRSAAILTLTLVAGLISLPIIGDEDAHQDVTGATIEARVLGNNLDVIRANENVMIAKYKLDLAKSKEDKSGSSVIETEKNKKYYVKQAQMNYDYAKASQTKTQADAVFAAQKKLYEYRLLLERIELEQAKYIRLEEELATIKLKIDLGRGTLSDQKAKELEIAKQAFEVTRAIGEKDRLYLELNKILGNDLDMILVLEKVEIPDETYYSKGLDQDIANAFLHNMELKKLETELDLLSIELQIYRDNNYGDKYDDTILSKKEAISDKNFDIKDKQLNVEYEIRSTYNNLLNAKDGVFSKELELENLLLSLELKQKRVELGLETEASLATINEQVAFAKLSLSQAKLDYFEIISDYQELVK